MVALAAQTRPRSWKCNAVALRLKELEALEKITEKIGTISVYSGLHSVLDNSELEISARARVRRPSESQFSADDRRLSVRPL